MVVVAVFIILSHIESVDALRNRFTTFYYPKPFTLYFILDGEEEEERERDSPTRRLGAHKATSGNPNLSPPFHSWSIRGKEQKSVVKGGLQKSKGTITGSLKRGLLQLSECVQ